ncbi:hypothetical protein HDU98_010833 [Podochytrium sp. JEL0797]|nr:hypothetical protein HDU98_010833 [Podochytrium sp. JEL0797]
MRFTELKSRCGEQRWNGTGALDMSLDACTAEPTPDPSTPLIVPKEEKSVSFAVQETHAFLSGIMFFTRVSVPKWVNHSMYWLSLSTAYFPVIGVIVGLVGFAFFSLGYYLFPGSTLIPTVWYSLATIRFTGAFHEDGLADMCDGFGGGWTRTSILRIMRDSCIGVFAGLGLAMFQLTKLAAVSYLLETTPLGALDSSYAVIHPRLPIIMTHVFKLARIGGILISGHVLGRWCNTYLLHRYKVLFLVTNARVVFATASAGAIVAGSLWIGALSVQQFVVEMVMLWLVCCYITVTMGRYINRVVGGVIGDCLGATNQIVECATYLVLGVNWIRVFGNLRMCISL